MKAITIVICLFFAGLSGLAQPSISGLAVSPGGRKYLQVGNQPFLMVGAQLRTDYLMQLEHKSLSELREYFELANSLNITTLQVQIGWKDVETSSNVYDSSTVLTYLRYCDSLNLKLELLWYGSYMCGYSVQGYLPAYVVSDTANYPELNATQDFTGWLGKHYFLKPNTPNIIQREGEALRRLMGFIYNYDSSHGNKHVVIGMQIENEPDMLVSRHNTMLGYTTEQLWPGMLAHLDTLGKIVKLSNYKCFTRVNLTTDAGYLDRATQLVATDGIDFVGLDPYVSSINAIQTYLNQLDAIPGNFAHISENSGGYTNSDLLELTALKKGYGYDVFEVITSSAPELADWTYQGVYYPNKTPKIPQLQRLKAANLIYKKAWIDLAIADADNIVGFNLLTDEGNTALFQSLHTKNITIDWATSGRGVAFAVERNGYLTIASTGNDLISIKEINNGFVEMGHYDPQGNWIKEDSARFTNGSFYLTPLTVYRLKTDLSAQYAAFPENSGQFFNYSPSYIQTSATRRYMYFNRNSASGQPGRFIYWRKADLVGSNWEWGVPQQALAPGLTGWDSLNVMTPDVKKGSYAYNGHTYSWVMFYSGTDRDDNHHKQIGLAFADSPEGPWIKFSGNPVIQSTAATLGVSKPSSTSVDWLGRFLLFYTGPDNAVYRRDINIADLSNISIGTEYKLFANGLTSSDNAASSISNIAISYEGSTDRFYMVTQRSPYPIDNPSDISAQLQVAYTAGANIWNNTGSWTVDGEIIPTVSGKARNHKPGLLTDFYGILSGGPQSYVIAYTGSDTGSNSLWTYRIFETTKNSLTNNPLANLIYELAPRHDTLMRLDVAGGLTSNTTNVQIFHQISSNQQRWQLVEIGNGSGYYSLIPQNAPSKKMDIAGAGTTDGTDVWIWDAFPGAQAQQFKLIDLHDGFFELAPRIMETMRVDVAGAGTTDGTDVWIYHRNGNAAQQWKFISSSNVSGLRKAANTYAVKELEDTTSQDILAYPNPSDGAVFLRFSQPVHLAAIRIFDTHGRTMHNTIFSGQVFNYNLSHAPAGIYFISVKRPGTENPVIRKIITQ